MSKPTQLPRWATGGSAKVTPEPTEGKKDLGFVASEKPPESYVNWAFRRIYDWLVYLDGLTNEALTWAAKHTFNAGLASGVAPSGATDVVRKTELDAETTARTTHESLTSPHSATAAATAARLTLRDANGGVAFGPVVATGLDGGASAVHAVGGSGANSHAAIEANGVSAEGLHAQTVDPSAPAVAAVAYGAGPGVQAVSDSGPGVQAIGNATRAPLQILPSSAPSAPANGDVWIDASSNMLKVRINGVTKTVTLT